MSFCCCFLHISPTRYLCRGKNDLSPFALGRIQNPVEREEQKLCVASCLQKNVNLNTDSTNHTNRKEINFAIFGKGYTFAARTA